MSRNPIGYDRKLAEVASRRDRFKIPRAGWDERDWRVHHAEKRKRAVKYAPLTGEPVIQPLHVTPTWSPLSPPPKRVSTTAKGRRVDQILHNLGIR